MRFARLPLGFPPLVLASVLCTAGISPADPKFLDAGLPVILEFGGDSDNLPVNCQITPEQLVAWARNMSAVRVAMREFERRGYEAVPEADTGRAGCGSPSSGVVLAYQKPGLFIDSFHVAVPLIVVGTSLHTGTGEPTTVVTAGIMMVDGETGLVFTGDSLLMFQAADHSFDVGRNRTGGGGGLRRISGVEVLDIFDRDSWFNRWLRCSGWGTLGCVALITRLGGPGLTPIKVALLLGEPHLGIAILSGCWLGSSLTCIGSLSRSSSGEPWTAETLPGRLDPENRPGTERRVRTDTWGAVKVRYRR